MALGDKAVEKGFQRSGGEGGIRSLRFAITNGGVSTSENSRVFAMA
jgi:hypothetical protein